VLVLSYVHGVSVFDLRQLGPVPTPAVLHMGRQLADALDAIHHASDEWGQQLGILHRDVTSGNVMIGDDGHARLIDLGIARSYESQAARTRTGCMRGTLRYIAPELFDGDDPSPQSDLWALGIVLLEAALGRPVWRGNDAEVISGITAGDPLKLLPGEFLDGRVARVCRWLLQKDPDMRPQRGREVAALLSMSAKDFDDPRAVAQQWVQLALDDALVSIDEKASRSTRELMQHASRVYTDARSSRGDNDRLSPTRMHQARVPRDVSIETDVWFETTEVAESPRETARMRPAAAPPRHRPAHEAILAYAEHLRAFEAARYDTSGEIPLR
jgi:serine/threonine-protein kinase